MKKIFFSLVLLFVFIVSVSAQEFDLKHYKSKDGQFSGVAGSYFFCSIDSLYDELMQESDEEISKEEFEETLLEFAYEEFMNEMPGEPVKKLTKKNTFLLDQAMNEWDYSKNELYFVLCADREDADEGIFLIVKTTGKKTYDWWAWIINDSSFY